MDVTNLASSKSLLSINLHYALQCAATTTTTITQIKLLTLAHRSVCASYATSCTSSECIATEQPSHYPVPATDTLADIRPRPVLIGFHKFEPGTSLHYIDRFQMRMTGRGGQLLVLPHSIGCRLTVTLNLVLPSSLQPLQV